MAAKQQQRTAIFRFQLSDMRPNNIGEKASPKAWIINIFTAKAMEWILLRVAAMIAAEIGPVGKNKQIMAIPKQIMAVRECWVCTPSQVGNKSPLNENPMTQKYALLVFLSKKSAAFPPIYVPIAPHMTTKAPKSVPA